MALSIIVTDLTRFHNQGLVCLAGINPDTGQCIRPFLMNTGGGTDYLNFQFVKARNIIPGSYLDTNFIPKPNSHRPHTEDHIIGSALQTPGNATSEQFMRILDATSSTTIAAGFGSNPVNKYFAMDRPPPISIFTLKLTNPRDQFLLTLTDRYGPAFKVNITDAADFSMNYLKVTDLGFSDHLAKIQAEVDGAQRLSRFLLAQDVLYLRVGLGQHFAPNNDESRRGYYVQINGIYSFPSFRQDLRMYD